MTDYISREELDIALDSLCDRVCAYSKKQRWVMCGSCPLGSAFDVVEELPAADVVEQKYGKWIEEEIRGDIRTVCSNCEEETGTIYEFNYCPNCGARMVTDGQDET